MDPGERVVNDKFRNGLEWKEDEAYDVEIVETRREREGGK
jgi:hypothetical protein